MKSIKLIIILFFNQLTFAQNNTNDIETLSVDSNTPVVSGFYNRINIGLLGGSNSSPSLTIINGYSFNEHWSAGFGLGTEILFGRGYIPTFFEGNYNILKSKTSPWLNLMAGYEIPFENFEQVKGGFTCGGKIGFTYFGGEHVGISTSIGFRYIQLRDKTNWWGWDDFITIRDLNRYEFRLGVVFK